MPAPSGAARRAALWLSWFACVAASTTGCASLGGSSSTASATAAAATALASGDSGCATALNAVATYGPTVVRDHNTFEKAIDDAEIELLVFGLDTAADATGNPTKARDIRTLASAYQKYRDAKGDEVASVTEAILADTNRLDAVCARA